MTFWRSVHLGLRGLLVAAAASGAASASSASAQSTDPATCADDAAWEAARSAGTIDALQRYLEAYPVGCHAGEAFRLIVTLSEADPVLIEPAAGGPADAGGGDLY